MSRQRASDGDGGPPSASVAEFERIDWERIEESPPRPALEHVVFLVGLLALGAVYTYHERHGGAYLVMRWIVTRADWLLLFAALVLVAYGAVPLLRTPRRTVRLAARLRRRPATALSLVFLAGVTVMALWALLTDFRPDLTLQSFQPPVWDTVPYVVSQGDCVGRLAEGYDPQRPCYGTWEYPLGTDRWGYGMIDLLLVGARPVAYAAIVTLGVIVPLATAVGLVAGYYGGLVDDLLMGYVDVQLSVPAIVIYLIVFMFVLNSIFVFLVAFGLLSWGGIARIVRSETLQRREEGYVLSARAVGAPDRYILRRHLLPNVTNTAVPAAFHLVAVIILTEAGLSFLGFNVAFQSWGMTVGEGLFNGPRTVVWWNSTFPAIALALTVAACKVVGDGLRDALDPRGDS
ncbi:ABC transporter permease [Natronomonas halophila]|uniref:ABC transporter permease n=1 Tax=Natronomonas halophila TaxID=2747817 RepID=UPI0015B7050E|nr:ABC transporter permease [Natronomonas halophila]QLD84863.1 ABC transporter permease [Natronomonas halophila]